MDNLTQYDFWQLVMIIVSVYIVIKAIYDAIVWLLDKFNIYHSSRTKQEKLEEELKKNTEMTNDTIEKIDKVTSALNKNFEIQKVTIRHMIIKACETYLDRGWVYSYELESTEDMYQLYQDLGGNSYCSTMMNKIRQLQVKNGR